MAVKMRLTRIGKKKSPFYRVVIADERAPRDGKFIESIGTYDPKQDPSVFKIDEEKAKKWLSNGAKPTETVGKLLKQAGIIEK
ncbi:MAG: 30S ribosomal protein S16 [Lachnospiraceae bacterium]|nr:30S ribosomal protein S16 [Lachnospiraceae bacterium]